MSLMVNTNQEAFDMAVERFFDGAGQASQKGAEGGPKVCRYRTVDGNACAVGALIEPDTYREWFEGAGLHKLVREHSLELGQVDVQLLADLQVWHDMNGNWDGNYPSRSAVGRLRVLAAGMGLDDSIIERLREGRDEF